MRSVIDALGREVALSRAPRRIVSLVPSETESVAALAGVERLIGRTDYCEEPAGQIESILSVGGTKSFSVEHVRDLQPDLILANQEENARPRVEALIAAGLPVHVSFPCSVVEGVAYLESLATLLDLDLQACAQVREARELRVRPIGPGVGSAFVPIWRDPLMTFDDRAYASDVLRFAGTHNVFADRLRRYPLRADLSNAEAWSAERVGDRDTRYPRVTLDEVCDRRPSMILLPDEPYRFGVEDAAAFTSRVELSAVPVVFVSGKDLFWYGTRMVTGIRRLAAALRQ